MRTSPGPNVPPIPGMCPGVAVAAGKGGSGGKGGKGAKKGKGKKKAPAKKKKKPAKGAKKSAKKGKKKAPAKKKKKRSDPVDVVTGAVTTHPREDVSLQGPLPLRVERSYDSSALDVDVGLGPGWGLSVAWRIEVHRRHVEVIDGEAVVYEFDLPRVGDHVVGMYGMALHREPWGFRLEVDDDERRLFTPEEGSEQTYLLTAIDDRNGNRIAIRHDGRLVSEIVDSAQRVVRFERDGEHIGAIRVKNAEVFGQWLTLARYAYDDDGRLVRAEDAAGFAEQFAYDDDDRLIAATNKKGLTYHYRYDDLGRCIETWGSYAGTDGSLLPAAELERYLADGHTPVKGIYHCRFDYFPDEYTEVTDTTQVCRYFGDDELGLVDKAVEGTNVETREYDEHGHLIELIDGQGARWVWERDERGRVLSQTDPSGRTTLVDRDSDGLPVRVVDGVGNEVRYTYDRYGNIVSIEGPTGVITMRYDGRGLLEELIRPNGVKLRYAWDAAGNLVSESVGDHVAWRYTYDALGQATSITDPEGAVRRFAWGPRGELQSVLLANGSLRRFEWDEELNLTLEIAPDGSTTRSDWSGMGVVRRIVDGRGCEYAFEYDWEQQLRRVTNPAGERWCYEYDRNGRLSQETTFDGRRFVFVHDAAGNIQQMVDPNGRTITLAYDPFGRVTSRETADETQTFEWGPTGLLERAVFGRGMVEFERDADGNVVCERQTVDGVTHEVRSTFDPDGLLLQRATDLGYLERVGRDDCGRRVLTEFMGRRVQHVRSLAGNEVERRLPGSGRVLSKFDPAGNLEERLAVGAAPVGPRGDEPEWVGRSRIDTSVGQSYRYVSGHLRQIWDRRQGLLDLSVGPLGELTAAMSGGTTRHARLDAAGNPLRPGEDQRVYGPGGRLLSKGNVHYRYDDAGRLIERADGDRLRTFEWNDLGMLVRVVEEGVEVELVYDPFARRLVKQVRRGEEVETTRFVWDSDRLLHEWRPECAYSFVYDDDQSYEPLAHVRAVADRPAELAHYLVDRAGVPRHLLDDDANVLADLEHGIHDVSDPSGATPFRFLGQHYDADVGLTYNRWRYYDQETGQYVSPDPLGLEGGLNDRAYVPNSWEGTDPLGLKNLSNSQVDSFIDANIPKGTSGVYTIVDKDGKTAYVGKANDVNSRLKSPGHKKARDLLKQPGTTVKVQKVDTSKVGGHKWKNPAKGNANETVSKDKAVGRTLMVEETNQYKQAQANYPGVTMTNSHQPLSDPKHKVYQGQYPPDTSGGTLGPYTVPG